MTAPRTTSTTPEPTTVIKEIAASLHRLTTAFYDLPAARTVAEQEARTAVAGAVSELVAGLALLTSARSA